MKLPKRVGVKPGRNGMLYITRNFNVCAATHIYKRIAEVSTGFAYKSEPVHLQVDVDVFPPSGV